MSVETAIEAAREFLGDADARGRAQRQAYHLRTPCPFGGRNHPVMRAPMDPEPWPDNVTFPGFICFADGLLFGGGLGLVQLREVGE